MCCCSMSALKSANPEPELNFKDLIYFPSVFKRRSILINSARYSPSLVSSQILQSCCHRSLCIFWKRGDTFSLLSQTIRAQRPWFKMQSKWCVRSFGFRVGKSTSKTILFTSWQVLNISASSGSLISTNEQNLDESSSSLISYLLDSRRASQPSPSRELFQNLRVKIQ